MKSNGLKFGVAILIFLFAVALAYFTADYFGGHVKVSYRYAHDSTYWLTLLSFAAAYIITGIGVARVLPVALGLLFSADILLLHTLLDQYSDITEFYKTIILGGVLVFSYWFAWSKLRDMPTTSSSLPNSSTTSTV